MKSKFKSVTLWVNFAGLLALGICNTFGIVETDHAAVGYVLTIANFALRFKTTEALA
jgi:hypothetical protein